MILQTLFNDFKERFFNYPVDFADDVSSDGATSTYQLSQYPLVDFAPYLPIVKINGTQLTEGVDFSIDYAQGILNLFSAPVVASVIRVDGYHAKCTLTQFISYYNRAIKKLKNTFAIEGYQKIDYTDVAGATASDEITEIDLTVAPYNLYDSIYEILQNKDDFRSHQFSRKANTLLLTLNTGTLGYQTARTGVMSDYLGARTNKSEGQYSTLMYPFYINGTLKYKEITTSGLTALNTAITVPDDAYEQLLLLLGINMYLSNLEILSKLRATSVRAPEIMAINANLMSLNAQLMTDLRMNGLGKGQSPTTFIKVNPVEA